MFVTFEEFNLMPAELPVQGTSFSEYNEYAITPRENCHNEVQDTMEIIICPDWQLTYCSAITDDGIFCMNFNYVL